MDQDAGCTLFLSLAGLSSPQNIDEVKEEMRAGEDRTNKRIDEVKEEMRAGEDRTNKRIDEVKEEMRAGEDRTNKRIDEVKVEMKEFKQEMGEIKSLLIQALRLPPPPQP